MSTLPDDGTNDFDHIQVGDPTPFDLDNTLPCMAGMMAGPTLGSVRLLCTRTAEHRGQHIATGNGVVLAVAQNKEVTA